MANRSIPELLALPGRKTELNGWVKTVESKAPTDKDKDRASKGGYDAKTKYLMTFQPNDEESLTVKFDPEQYSVAKLSQLQGAFCTLSVSIKSFKFDDGRTADTINLLAVVDVGFNPNPPGQAAAQQRQPA